jgi:hypothetical protein
LFQTLRGLLGEAFALHQKGAIGSRLGRAYGMADGYMRALLDLELATPNEIRILVVEERAKQLGPATQELSTDPASRDTLAA